MAYESMEQGEKLSTSTPKPSKNLTLKEAIELGEYDLNYLSTFAEWHSLSRHIQFQYISEAIENRRKHLLMQWSELDRMIDYRLKPHLKEAQENIQKQLKKVMTDREKLFVEYSK
jgi:hypothetical protein